MLKYILENKHEDKTFKAAVIVNDMAELNIDKSLIDQTSLIQSDEDMIGMQNGCICCTLQSDLVEQIIGLTEKKKFNYILIEASGVSEPHEIAPLFEVEQHEHDENDTDHGHDHSKPQLGEVARLDTCVTLIDSADFYNNLGSLETYDQCTIIGTIPELMMDQVEFANIVIVNKTDLVKEEQINDITRKVALLNPKAKIVKTQHCKINLVEILHTSLYKDKEEFWVTSAKREEEAAAAAGKEETGKRVPEACTARFDIKSFVYRARKPFHPGRLCDLFLDQYFADPTELYEFDDDLEEDDEEENEKTEEEKKKFEEAKKKFEERKKKEMEDMQAQTLVRQKKREEKFGTLLRSKGFCWIATTNDIIGCWQGAGNVCRITPDCPWMCEMEWEADEEAEKNILKDMTDPVTGERYQYEDRRQEVVFIGHNMNKEAIIELLDSCLLNDEEMALGPEKWKETMEDKDKIRLNLDKYEKAMEEEEAEERAMEEGDEEWDDEEDEEGEEVEKEIDDENNKKKKGKGAKKRECPVEGEECKIENKKKCKA